MPAGASTLIGMDDRLDTPYELAPMIYLPLITIFRHSATAMAAERASAHNGGSVRVTIDEG
jgi:hypothetical protein